MAVVWLGGQETTNEPTSNLSNFDEQPMRSSYMVTSLENISKAGQYWRPMLKL
ncbi:hypothetical protein HOLleu_16749 [Holothuria leucospilota]|uniref:Uncharacterized protein n=1 Tax=Holothuria leucospilota TaxID=206669 RepID=A0A9Q1C688_HOLLE|nr:hypothetical protein HOLleu_16749 [Holothuria leucospilota]